MLRSTLIAAGAVMLCSAALAQQRLDASRLRPLTVQPQHAGVYNYATKRWMSPQQASALQASAIQVYNNTCTWTGAAYYIGMGACEEIIDEGRIPGGIGGAHPTGATTDNLIDFFEIQYCTAAVTGTVDIEVDFWNNLGGGCVGGIAPRPVATTGKVPTQVFDFGATAGYPLPGAAAPGGFACWIVGIGNVGFCMQSDGDGAYDNNLNLDQFAWSMKMSNVLTNWYDQGPIMSGEPSTSPVSGCTYNIPCGTDAFYSTDCGHGLDTEDLFWINEDRDAPGPLVPGGPGYNPQGTQGPCAGPLASPYGTACYWFQGYPNNPFSSVYMRMGSAGQCSGCSGSPVPYCTAGTTTNGCLGSVTMTGTPSASAAGQGTPCTITVGNIEGASQGIIFYGLTTLGLPWGTGPSFMCVKAPVERLGNQATGGATGTCQGSMSQDVNAYWSTHAGAVGQPLFVGETFYFQGWFRDPPAPKTTNLSNGLQITLCP